MKANDLLKVAKGMGFNAVIYTDIDVTDKDKKEIIVINPETDHFKEFNPTEGELMLWLLKKGWFKIVTQHSIEFSALNDINFTALSDDLKENLLNIALQVIENE